MRKLLGVLERRAQATLDRGPSRRPASASRSWCVPASAARGGCYPDPADSDGCFPGHAARKTGLPAGR
jgi:hypothetical protein